MIMCHPEMFSVCIPCRLTPKISVLQGNEAVSAYVNCLVCAQALFDVQWYFAMSFIGSVCD